MLANANAHICSFRDRREIKPTPTSASPATGMPIKKLCQAPGRAAGEMRELVDEVVLIVSVELIEVGVRFTHQAPTDCGLPSAFLRSG